MLLILDNLLEIKTRTLYVIFSFISSLIASYFYSDILIYVWVLPFVERVNSKKLIFTSLSEAFSSCIFVSLNVSSILSVIFLTYNAFCFVKPGLHKSEYHILRNFCKLLMVSLMSSLFFVYSFLIPLILNFFLKFEQSKLFELTLEAKIFEYLELISKLTFLLIGTLQLPMIAVFLVFTNMLNSKTLVNRRKEFLLTFFIIGALFSPPDVSIQLLIGNILFVIFESLIFGFGIVEEYDLMKWESCSNGKRWIC